MAVTLKLPGGKQVVFQPSPEEIQLGNEQKYYSYNIIGKGEVAIPSGTEIKQIEFECDLFGEGLKNYPGINTELWRDPADCEADLYSWQEKKKILKFNASETGVIGIECDVSIASLQTKYHGPNGNIHVSITLKVDKDIAIKYTTKKKKTKTKGGGIEDKDPGGGGLKPRKTPAKKKNQKFPLKYTIKNGDTLWSIAKKYYGNGSKWQVIYNKNKSVIEKAAKKHGKGSSNKGQYIYAGVKLTIPSL